MSSKKRPNRTCFVPGCNTGYISALKRQKEMLQKSPSLFKAPEDTVLLRKWQQAIRRADKEISSNNVVCALHFSEDDILCFFETKMPDGTVNYIKRERPKLRDGAIPTLFPSFQSLPSHLSKKSGEEQDNATSTSKKVKQEHADVADYKEVELNHGEIDEQVNADEVTLSKTLFEEIKGSLRIVRTPNKQWSGTFIPGTNEILFAEWDDSYIPKRRILIRNDMSFKVLLGGSSLSSGDADRINSINELENVLKSVNYATL